MPMNFTVPPDLEALVQKRLASGSFTNVEDVFRRALEAQDADENWTDEERRALDERTPPRAPRLTSAWTSFSSRKMPSSTSMQFGFTSRRRRASKLRIALLPKSSKASTSWLIFQTVGIGAPI